MNPQYKKTLITVVSLVIIMILPMLASAQFDGVPSENVDAPIDGGLSLLVAAGVGYGAKKLKAKREKQIKN